ncbi:Extracellular matrix-binding ebh [Babesia ovata]|uniref:Extracellular matrix-binding ebh n=1 Tax=Babesia ovata TaxID=189622 RepID=A0A2H6K7Q5_9APIC|nr:Extracellular matrix-binding ebh [Babesia ovata]GBE59027.1 Extracellular matrix-binding ebh [Babesia ovata]
MAPKALTDCPENLREAIDWLIQVKQSGGIPRLSDALCRLFDNVVQDAEESLLSCPESDGPSARDVISKLQGFRSSLTKDSAHPNKNILHNLCSAVESLLGYKSPGTYDGSGIVYGDASRLCDAVVAFLYRVISDVRRNQPYVGGRDKLGSVVRELEKARWSGHHGFAAVIPKVAGGLGEYNTAVKASNEKVKKPINEMLSYVKEDGNKLYTCINDLQVERVSGDPEKEDPQVSTVVSLIQQCKKVVKDFSRGMTSAQNAINDLNPKLRSKIENVRKTIKEHAEWLSKLYGKKQEKKRLDAMLHKIKTTLRMLGRKVKEKIRAEVHELVSLLKQRVRDIKSKLEEIKGCLEKYVQDLVKWMEEAKAFIKSVREYVNKIMEEIDGENKKGIDEAAGEIDRTLSEKVSELNKWIETADAAVQAAKTKATDVYNRLNKDDDKQNICRGIGKIEAAKTQVGSVNQKIVEAHRDLGTWNAAAKDVLGTALGKATTVRDRLSPDKQDNDHVLGTQIKNIDIAKQGLEEANKKLKTQVANLHSWISTAEDIRAKAQEKAEEAYSKLDVHAELSKNVNKIVKANEEINRVHNSLKSVHGNLGKWNEQARTVLAGAINKGEDVHKALDTEVSSDLKTQIEDISKAKGEIEDANTNLGGEVTALGSWHKTASEIVTKADKKCQDILDKVYKGDNVTGTDIHQNANKLKEKAESLLEAYKEAYPKVQHLVEDVKNAVKDLEASMKEDLGNIRNRIVEEMKKHVGEMLEQIKGKVEGIKGKDSREWNNKGASGLLGIVSAVQKYATEFRHENFAEIAKGWLEATILRYNGVVRRILGKKDAYNKSEKDIEEFAIGMKDRLKTDVTSVATEAFKSVNTVSGSIQTNINAVKTACEAFANGLDQKLLQQGNEIVSEVKEKALTKGSLVSGIKNCVCECGNCNKIECGKKAAAELIMCALTSTVRQVGNELKSVFLGSGANVNGKSTAEELDNVVGLTKTLDSDLDNAVKKAKDQPGANGNVLATQVEQIEQQVNSVIPKDEPTITMKFGTQIMKKYAEKRDGKDPGNKYHDLLNTHIPQAMKPFTKDPKLNSPDDVPARTKELGTFVSTIKQELQAIAHFVDKDKQAWPDKLESQKPQDEDGIRQRLKDLSEMLENQDSVVLKGDGLNIKTVEGLQAIHDKIHGLQTGQFNEQPAAIGQTVDQIKAELGMLRGKLKKNGDKDDVINALTDLQTVGLDGKSGDKWNPINGKGQPLSGLGKIHGDLQKGNAILPEETRKITEAIIEIRRELARVGFKLQGLFTTNDVIDELTWLGNKIGKNGIKAKDNLHDIYEKIRQLQQIPFQEHPTEIDNAKKEIVDELKDLQNELQGNPGSDVIATLKDLKDKGLSEKWDKNTNGNQKGLAKINSELQHQQSELSTQPENIRVGVQDITGELDSLRQQLNTEVTEKLKKLKESGLTEGKTPWTDKGESLNGIQKITTDIEAIKTTDVKEVKDKLKELCTAIRTEANELSRDLKRLKGDGLEELTGIKDNLSDLLSEQVRGVIRELKSFVKFLENGKAQIIRDLHAFVDKEIKEAEEALTREARRQYVESVQDALKHFALKAESELETLPKEIDEDLTIGFKGLMRQMEGERSENINRLRNVQSRMLRALSSAFQNFFAPLDEYLREEIERVKKQSDDEKNPSLPKSEEPYAAEWDAVHSDVNALLNYLCVTQGFDDRLRGLLHNLTDALTQLRPQGFQKPSTPTLDSVSRGLSAFAGEFGGAYISTYSGAECREADADKYAKVLLSFIPMTHNALQNLAEKCGSNWRSNKICEFTPDGRDNGLGNYLTKCGFKVSPTDGLQEGELQNHGDMNGEQIHALLNSPIPDVTTKMLVDGEPLENGINVVDLVALFHNMVCLYLQACHLKVHESPRHPCTVRDMLSWLAGLQYTLVAEKLADHCKALLNRKCDDNDVPNRDDAVMAQCINGLPMTIATACSHANSLLIAIQGHGRGFDLAAYPYSVDFANNRAQLHYPADPDELLDMLREIVCRLCRVLYFLYAQCCRATSKTKGWRECHYGRQVPSSHWQCNTLDKQSTDASHNCPPTSTLQSFLTDSCPNLLPHRLTVVDSAIECANCPVNLPGQQCLTPLGFWDIGLAASVERTGRELAKCLGRLCSDADACLFQLCRTLCLLCPSAPRSLGDVFSLFSQMLRMWDTESSRWAYSHHESYLTHLNDDAINGFFPLRTELHGSYQNAHLTDALQALAGHDHENSEHSALSSLSAKSPCQAPSGCAPFLQPLSLHSNHTFPQKHAQLYISWVVWLAWQFWDLLQQLLEALNNIDCTAHGCATCPCYPDNHGHKDACHCPSLVECGGPLPTLYRYGLTYRNAHILVAGSQKMRCSDLNGQLTKALHSKHFANLFHQIDQLLWHIRMPFLFTITSLWLIATLYIAHSLLYRMDVLRIRSHLLTTRASHLIDVKALLAGSRRMLSLYRDVDYFDDDPLDLSQHARYDLNVAAFVLIARSNFGNLEIPHEDVV